MRFGARGIYVLDITESDGKESEANKKLRWEFTSASPGAANLGYTYDSANLARLANGKWVVLLSSGYFPNTGPESTIPPATQDQTSLFVIDLVVPDFIPLADEILLGLGSLLLANFKSRKAPPTGNVIEGQSHR